MKKWATVFLCLVLCILLLGLGFDYLREAKLLKASGLDLSRASVNSVYSDYASINFGADSREILGYKLPPDYSALGNCGNGGYSELKQIDLAAVLKAPDLKRGLERGCVRWDYTGSGVTYIFIVFDNELYIKVF